MADTQAYAGQADRQSGTSEWNRQEFGVRSVMNKMATMTLVKVVSAAGGRVDVQPLVAQMDGAGNAIPHGTIHDLPVWRYQAGDSAIILDPVAGDIGLAVFAHSDISSVKETKDAAPPGSKRRFDWSDGVYLGGVLNSEPTSFVRFDSTGNVTIKAPKVTIDAAVEMTSTLKVAGKDFATHRHTGVQTGGGVSGPVQ